MSLKLSALRGEVAAIAEAVTEVDVAVVDYVPDQVAVPAVLVAWSEPWLTRSTGCEWECRVEVMAIAGRLEPGFQYGVLEGLIGDLADAYVRAGHAVTDSTAPYPIELGGVTYLAASLVLTTDLTGS